MIGSHTEIDCGEFVTDCVPDRYKFNTASMKIWILHFFNLTEYKMYDIKNDIDLENHSFNNVNKNSCEYYTEEQFNRMWTWKGHYQ